MSRLRLTGADDGLHLLLAGISVKDEGVFTRRYLVAYFHRPDASIAEHPFFINSPGYAGHFAQALARKLFEVVLSPLGLDLSKPATWSLLDMCGQRIAVSVKPVVNKHGELRKTAAGELIHQFDFSEVNQTKDEVLAHRAQLRADQGRPMFSDNWKGGWDYIATRLIELDCSPDYVGEVQVAWDRDCPEVRVDEVNLWRLSTGALLLYVIANPRLDYYQRCYDWCHHHRRWERVDGTTRDTVCNAPWTPGSTR